MALVVAALLTQPGRVYLPTIQVNQYRWPQAGFSVMGANRDRLPAFYGADSPPMWFQDWWLGCELYSDNGQPYGQARYHAAYVPMIWRAWDDFALRCNDGRPLLVGNEPELASQANLTPMEMATLLHTAVGQWAGPVWCCGVMVQHQAYMAQVIAEYRRLYGVWPQGVGVHAHLYVVGPDGSPVITSLSDDDVTGAQADFDRFMALLAANGLLGRRVVISECCVLSNALSRAQVLSAAARLVNHAMSYADVATVAWYSVTSRGAGAGEFVSSDLVGDGQVNALGRAWLDYAAGRVLRGD